MTDWEKNLDCILVQTTKSEINVLEIDWTKFEQSSTAEFQDIDVSHFKQNTIDKLIAPKGLSKGTILEISGLNSVWDYKKLVGLKQHLQRLINPSQMGVNQDFVIYIEAKEFVKEDEKNAEKHPDLEPVNGPVKNFVFEKLGIQTTWIGCGIDDNGETLTTELFDKDKFIFRLKEKNEYSQLKNINVKLFYLNKPAK